MRWVLVCSFCCLFTLFMHHALRCHFFVRLSCHSSALFQARLFKLSLFSIICGMFCMCAALFSLLLPSQQFSTGNVKWRSGLISTSLSIMTQHEAMLQESGFVIMNSTTAMLQNVWPLFFSGHLSIVLSIFSLLVSLSPSCRVGDARKIKFNILVTNYETVLVDIEELRAIQWQYLVVDEGHRLKNKNARLLQALNRLHCSHRLLLTGTPIQNNTLEV